MNPEYDYLFKLLVRFASARPRPRPRTTREMTTGVPLREISRRSVDARAEAWRRCAREDARAKTWRVMIASERRDRCARARSWGDATR